MIKNLLPIRRLAAFVLDTTLPARVIHCENMSVMITQLRPSTVALGSQLFLTDV